MGIDQQYVQLGIYTLEVDYSDVDVQVNIKRGSSDFVSAVRKKRT